MAKIRNQPTQKRSKLKNDQKKNRRGQTLTNMDTEEHQNRSGTDISSESDDARPSRGDPPAKAAVSEDDEIEDQRKPQGGASKAQQRADADESADSDGAIGFARRKPKKSRSSKGLQEPSAEQHALEAEVSFVMPDYYESNITLISPSFARYSSSPHALKACNQSTGVHTLDLR